MNRTAILLLAAVVALGGCATRDSRVTPEKDVVDIDPESLDYAMNGDMEYVSTPDHVVVGTQDGIIIQTHKMEAIYDEQAETDVQNWDVTATNTTNKGVCVLPVWKLLDFEYISNGPTEQYVPPFALTELGQMVQQLWVIDGVPVAPPPSGYLEELLIRDPVADAEQGEECTHLVDEADLVPEEDIEEDPDVEK